MVGAVLIPGAKAPKLITREMLSTMQRGSVIVDVTIDQGGALKPQDPRPIPIRSMKWTVWCTTAWPNTGAVAKTSTLALTNATLPYAGSDSQQGLETGHQGKPGSIRTG